MLSSLILKTKKVLHATSIQQGKQFIGNHATKQTLVLPGYKKLTSLISYLILLNVWDNVASLEVILERVFTATGTKVKKIEQAIVVDKKVTEREQNLSKLIRK